MTTRWTFGSFAAAFMTDRVPATAGLMKSSGFSTFQWKGEATWTTALTYEYVLASRLDERKVGLTPFP